jgi:hypothetical protein
MDLMVLLPKTSGDAPSPTPVHWLGVDDEWSAAEELGPLAAIDQDTANLERVQQGLKASHKAGVTFADYQESRLRHFHFTLDEYVVPR